MKATYDVVGILTLVLLCSILGFVSGESSCKGTFKDTFKVEWSKVAEAVKVCEERLPRNVICQPTVGLKPAYAEEN